MKYKHSKEKLAFFKPENAALDKQKTIDLENIYTLKLTPYKTREGCWNYSRAEVYRNSDQALVADIKRNYSAHPWAFVNHPNGHHYFLFGENYQGQTIVELDTRKKISFLPKEAKRGAGFCWADIQPSPCKTMLAVVGCIWGGPYEAIVHDFTDPMSGKWLSNRLLDYHYADTASWNDDSSLTIGYETYFCTLFNKEEGEVTESDWKILEEIEKEKGSDFADSYWETRVNQTAIWTPKEGLKKLELKENQRECRSRNL